MVSTQMEYKILAKLGDHIDTDVMTPGKYLTSYEPEHLASICLCDLVPDFTDKMKEGGILIAGKNFGCGSSRETAPIALKAAGVKVVIAEEFARIFYRNAFNIGLPCIVCEEIRKNADIGDVLHIDLEKGAINNLTNKKQMAGMPIPEDLLRQLMAGGVMEYLKKMLKESAAGTDEDVV